MINREFVEKRFYLPKNSEVKNMNTEQIEIHYDLAKFHIWKLTKEINNLKQKLHKKHNLIDNLYQQIDKND